MSRRPQQALMRFSEEIPALLMNKFLTYSPLVLFNISSINVDKMMLHKFSYKYSLKQFLFIAHASLPSLESTIIIIQ